VRLVITGAAGGLARAFLAQVPPHHEIHPFTHSELDVGDHHGVMQTVVPIAPDAIVNLAAMTAVDACEADPEGAFRANALGPQSLALAARACGATLLHVSTDYVFDGLKGTPYDEVDHPNPINVYGRSKLAGERLVRDIVPEHIIVRTAWIVGGGSDFVSRSLPRLAAGEPVDAVADRIGSPTPVGPLAERLLPLLLTSRYGTYHVAGPHALSWFEALSRCVAATGLPGEVRPVSAADLRLKAPRPRRSDLVSVFAGAAGIEPLPPVDEALGELVEELVR
jgi:dTDP-4-dehydrorhamnose reductase